MRPQSLHPWTIVRWPIAIALIVSTVLPAPKDPSAPAAGPAAHSAAHSIVGPQECAECHVEEHGVWQASSHFTGGKTLSRSAAAKEIASALGVRRIKGEERCTTCHFTMQESRPGRFRATAGVSCESCHGPAQEWIEVHADFGPDASNASEESDEHRIARIQHSQEMGMIHPGSLYELGAQCYQCHSIDDQELIGKAGHPTGTDFELVAWSQGEVRHNFSARPGAASTERNLESSRSRRASMYVIGRGLELEFALRALSKADTAAWNDALERAQAAWSDVRAIANRLAAPSLTEMARRMDSIDLSAATPPANLIADVAELTRKLEPELRELDLSPTFSLLPEESGYRGTVAR